ncbi:MAG: hypothetical protein NTZ17_01210 [Phycisphaerae bacterium]|nr:hypothetical protein [Phycisphaerae bacterium]
MAVHRDEGIDLPDRDRCARRRWTKWLWWAIVVSLLAGGLYFASLRHHWRAEFHQRIETIHAAGFPVTGQELDAWYPWPQAGENAANWITGAATLQRKLDPETWKPLESLVGRGGERQNPSAPLPGDLKELLERYVRDNAKALESLHEAAAIAECRYPVDLSQGPSVLMTHISDVHEGCRLLCLEAVLHAENKDPNGTARDIHAVLYVARSLDREPMMISPLVRMAAANVATVALERAMNQTEFREEQLEGLQKAFSDTRGTDGLLRALAGTRCMGLIVYERPQALDRRDFDLPLPVPLLEAYDALGLSAREGIVFLDYMDECVRIVQLPTFERPAAIEAAEAHLRARRGVFLRQSTYMAGLIRRETHEVAWREVAATSLAVQRYDLAHGNLPESPGQLVPDYLAAVPVDPFDGLPLRFKRTDRGFAVYSVGEDCKDDSGKEEPRKKQGET